jgi:hypothetical protein
MGKAEREPYSFIGDCQGIIKVHRTLDSQFVVVENMALDSLSLQWNKDQKHIARD